MKALNQTFHMHRPASAGFFVVFGPVSRLLAPVFCDIFAPIRTSQKIKVMLLNRISGYVETTLARFSRR
jgi:hypothetical protein